MITVGICDDEKKQVELLERYVIDYFSARKVQYTIIKSYAAKEFIEHASEYDIAYLDIDLGSRDDGVHLGHKLREKNKRVKLIYVTSHAEYVLPAAGAYYLRYLQKPVNAKEFKKILHDAIGFLNIKKIIEVRTNRSLSYINLDEILYLKTENRNVYVVKKDSVERIYDTLEEVEAKSDDFVFIHRSCMVNMRNINQKTFSQLEMANGEKLQIAQTRLAEFEDKLENYTTGGIL